MPYITYSKKGQELLQYCTAIRMMFGNASVYRRGKKSIRNVVEDARSKGFKNILVVCKSNTLGITTTLIKTSTPETTYTIKSTYTLAKNGQEVEVNPIKGAINGEKGIIEEAED